MISYKDKRSKKKTGKIPRYYKDKSSIVITEKIPLSVSASSRKIRDNDTEKLINKRFYTYRLTIPKIFLNFLIKNNIQSKKNEFTLIPKNYREYYFTNYNNISEDLYDIKIKRSGIFETNKNFLILGKTKDSYKITLPKSALVELYVVDKYLDTMKDIKNRKPIYIYLKLKIDFDNNTTILTLKFENEITSYKTVRLFKKKIFCGNPLIYHNLLGMLHNLTINKSHDINDINFLVSRDNEVLIDESYNLQKLVKLGHNKKSKIRAWNANLNSYKSRYDIKLIKLMVEENNQYYIKLWNIVPKDNLNNIDLKNFKIEIDDILNNNLQKYTHYPEAYIDYNGIIFETSYNELNDLDKDLLDYIDNLDEFMFLLLRYKQIHNIKGVIIE